MSIRDCLPVGTVVGEFEIRRILGQGGFGIVYEAYEAMLDRRVALKEYFLQGFSRREGLEVVPVDADAVAMFNSGMARFIREARLLSMLNERTRTDGSLVAVYRVFQAHSTAFMAMKLYEGQTLRQVVMAAPDRVTEPWLTHLLLRMLDALNALHSLPGENLVHRDVSPDNIIIQPDGAPVLLDFGATRKVDEAVTSLIYKPGYSPIEQYTDTIAQGPWTDLYALSGVAYFAIAAQSPMPAVDRYAGGNFVTAAERGAGRFSPEFLAVVDHGMAVLPEQRYQRAEDMRAALLHLSGQQADRPLGAATAFGGPTLATRATPAPTATYVAPPPTTPLTTDQQGVARDEDTTQVNPAAHTRTHAVTPADAPATAQAATAQSRVAAPQAALMGAEPAPAAATATASTPAPRPDAAPRRTGMLALGGVAAAAVAALVWWQVRSGDAGPQGPASGGAGASAAAGAASVAAGPASAAVASPASVAAAASAAASAVAATANVPGLGCTAAAADWACVLEGLARLSSQPGGLVLRVSPASVKVGQAIALDITAAQSGLLQVMAVDESPSAKLTLAFPNERDRNNRIQGGQALRLPRPATWGIVAQPPTGRSWMVAVVSSEALPSTSPLHQGVSLAEAVRAFAEGQPLRLLGLASCVNGSTPGGTGSGAACPKTLSIQPADFIIR
ncbi:MAG: DUF4384 domain-containing protein [Burkholderiales bacterium]|nr:DUF4384 domain-containing protein [Burkholderiales bacterium]